MKRFTRRTRTGVGLLASAMLGLGAVGTLALGPQATAQNENEFSCRASVVNVQGKGPLASLHVEPLVANGGNDPCRTSTATGASIPLPTGAGDHVNVVRAVTTDNENLNSPSNAAASSQVVDAQVGGSLLHAEVLTANAAGNDPDGLCGPQGPTFSGDSHVVKVTLNGTVIEVPTTKSDPAHPTVDLSAIPGPVGPVRLFLREEIANNDGVTERALFLETGLVNVTISEASVGRGANPNNGLCNPPPGGNCPNPAEHDPFVDPTAPETQGIHPDCPDEGFTPPEGNGDPTGRDYVHFDRSINDTETSPNNSFTPVDNPDSRNRFYGDAGFEHDGDTTLTLEGKFYDDEDMHFRLAPLTIDAYYAPNDLAASPWRRFCGTGVIEPFEESSDGMDMTPPSAPFAPGQTRKFLVETFDEKWLNPDAPGGDHSDYWVIDIYAPGSNFDTAHCDPRDSTDHETSDIDYHSEGQTIAGNIEIHSNRVADDADETTTTTMDDSRHGS